MGPKSTLFNALTTLVPLIAGTFTTILLSEQRILITTLFAYSAGLSLFLVAKWSVIRQGRLITLGVYATSGKYKRYYWAGYSLMLVAVFMTATLHST